MAENDSEIDSWLKRLEDLGVQQLPSSASSLTSESGTGTNGQEPSSEPSPPSKAEAIRLLWERGELRFKLDPNQRKIYDLYKSTTGKRFVANCPRRVGKSFMACVLAAEMAIKQPGASIKFCAPTAKMVRKIIRPLFRQIFADCPTHLKPKENRIEGDWDFPNGSNITVAGADAGNVESLRGQEAHLCIIDEAGFIDDLKYVETDVLMPQTLTTSGRIIFLSTPPKTSEHYFKKLALSAEALGNYFTCTIYDNPRITAKDISEAMEACGGADTISWRREYLAQFITDTAWAVIPEFTPEAEKRIVQELQRPVYCDKYMGIDLGMIDATGGLLGYWDFTNACLVIEDEFLLQAPGTVKIAETIRAKEKGMWGEEQPLLRASDVDLRLQADLAREHKINIFLTAKDDKEAAVNAVRLLITNDKLRIHPRCKQLVHQLKDATWNEQRTSYRRSEENGHYDLIDALVYMVRNIRRTHNPNPQITYSKFTHHVPAGARPLTETEKVFHEMFVPDGKPKGLAN